MAGLPSLSSPRLEAIFRRQLKEGAKEGLGATAGVLARQTNPRSTELLLKSLRDEKRPGFRWILSSNARCHENLALAKIANDECMAQMNRKGALSHERSAPPYDCGCYPNIDIPPPKSLMPARPQHGTLGFSFDENAVRLRNLTLLVRPDLDDAIFAEALPDLEAIPREADEVLTYLFTNGDGFMVMLPRDQNPQELVAPGQAAARIEEALQGPRLVHAYLDGRRYSLTVAEPNLSQFVAFTNHLLEAVGSSRRLIQREHDRVESIPVDGLGDASP